MLTTICIFMKAFFVVEWCVALESASGVFASVCLSVRVSVSLCVRVCVSMCVCPVCFVIMEML